MNVHHLELFYYVARHGGISEAVRKMPYGIQQPAISAQVLQLEEHLGVTLFQRRPFALTEAGGKLYRFIEPFFSNLDGMAAEIRGETVHHLRIGASQAVLRDHLPELIRGLRRQFPKLRILLREGHPLDLDSLLQQREIDLAITAIGPKTAPATRCQPLLRLPLVLLVPKDSPLKSATALWKKNRIDEPLICLPAAEIICREFQRQLGRRGVEWLPGIEVSSLSLVETYVSSGFGIGLSVASPAKCPATVRELPLEDFDPISIGAIWRGRLPAVARAFLDAVVRRARDFQ